MNIASFLHLSAARHPDRAAIVFGEQVTTYRDLQRRVAALARGLTGLGVGPGDRVAVWMRNHPELIETLFATWRIGAVAVPVNPRATVEEVAYQVADSGAAALVHGSDDPAVGGIEQTRLVDVRGRTGVAYQELLRQDPDDLGRAYPVHETDPAWLFYTSGTTGRPKGAILTHANLRFAVVSWCADLHQVQPEDVVLHCAPLSHGAGFHALVAVARGACNVILERFSTGAVLETISRHRVTTTWLVPTQIRMLLDDPALDSADLSSLTHVVYGGSPMYLADIKEAVSRIGPVFCQLYGQGESPMTITFLRREDHVLAPETEEILTSAGVVRTGMEVRIADEDGREVPPGEVGEILVRGPAVMSGYWKREDATREALRDGWLHTGDLGRQDKRGYVWVLDRLKDLIISGGANVYAREVEDVILAHPQVHEVAVVGVPHRLWGEMVVAAVVATGDLDEAAVLGFCRARLADYKCPKQVRFVAELPKNAYGKVLKRELRRLFQAEPESTPAMGRSASR
ncbi:acyl-CoA synthetase [Carbonactinospora thermoautotrophica]|uniref:acyl-CoA synthetase n=1 Tax=Carbonactinospora thermoautotrophica TaxID=1469144 RepID=UPI0008340359|nr:long-chain fatty acid--CoA ligase [Carbonactinospora thermoautotrophica]